MKHALSWMFVIAIISGLTAIACGSANRPDSQFVLRRLRAAIDSPVTDAAARVEHNTALRDAVNGSVLDGKFRDEVEQLLGRGGPCSGRPACMERGFEPGDWVYDIGTDPEGGVARLPMLFVGFDTSGRVTRTRYLTVD